MWLKFLLGLGISSLFYWFIHNQNQDMYVKVMEPQSVLKPPNVEVPQPPSRSLLHRYEKAAVCSDKNTCSSIGSVILQYGGNAIDAAIATLICNGLITMQSMGLGGGVILSYYNRKEKKAKTIIGRERAPLNITLNGIQSIDSFGKSALSIAVPGELAAYHEAHKLYGSLSWSYLVQPTLKICYEGYRLTRHQHDALSLNEQMVRKNKLLSNMFVDPTTKLFYREGWHIKLPMEVCAAYKTLSEEGPSTFYNGTLASLIVKDLKEMGSPITMDDLNSYRVEVKDSLVVNLEPYYLHLPQPPSSGYIVGFIMKFLEYFKKEFSLVKDFDSLEVHRIVEALKFGFVKRWQHDADVEFNTIQNLFKNESLRKLFLQLDDFKTLDNVQYYGSYVKLTPIQDHGTAQISVLAPNGDAVSATSSLNYYGRMGPRSGILFNNAMCDFTIENFKNYFNLPNIEGINEFKAQKHPMSSMAPLIVTSKATGDVRLVVGAAGGSRIISTLVQILIRVLWQNKNIKEAIDAPRFHHQLLPNILEYEFGMLQQVVQSLEERGHKTERILRKNTAVCSVEKLEGGIVLANADYRKEGGVVGF